jgi:hypothetical protein
LEAGGFPLGAETTDGEADGDIEGAGRSSSAGGAMVGAGIVTTGSG